MITKHARAGRGPLDSRGSRSLFTAVVLAAVMLAVTSCGSSDGGGSDSSAELSSSEYALCELNQVRTLAGDASIEEVLTGDGAELGDELIAIGLFVEVRTEVVDDLGPYAAAAQAIQQRNEEHVAMTQEAALGAEVPLPEPDATDEELASARAADAFIAEGRCGSGGGTSADT